MEASSVSPRDIEFLIRDKYPDLKPGDASLGLQEDIARLEAGEPLAYVIGWMPFFGLRIRLDSKPLIPRSETEWWTELLIIHLKRKFGQQPFALLDLCAGSGIIGLAVLKNCPNAQVTFAELVAEHAELIRKNLRENGLDESRVRVLSGDLFAPLVNERFDIIATNPPYIPEGRALDKSVLAYEPREALYAGLDGLALIDRIALDAADHLNALGEIWVECDISNVKDARDRLLSGGAQVAEIRTDQYGRSRLAVGYYP